MRPMAGLLALTLLVGCSSSQAATRYGGDPVRVAADLGVCSQPQRYDTIAVCRFGDGTIGVEAMGSAAQRSYAVSMADAASYCALIGDVWEVEAPVTVLDSHLDVAAFVKSHHAEMHGTC